MRILVVIEDEALGVSLSHRLTAEGYLYDCVSNAEQADYYIEIRHYSLILAEWRFAKDEGLLEKVKYNRKASPVIVLGANDDKRVEIAALEQGADDYLPGPFDLDVLMARIKRSLQRIGMVGNDLVMFAGLAVHLQEEKVVYQDKSVDLSGKPLEVLHYLVQRPGQIVGKEQILDALWEMPELVTPNVVEVALHQIRQKVDTPLGLHTIETIRRRGYRFVHTK
jgi:two-component system OmpR family response regulator